MIAACALGGLMASPAFAQESAPAPTRQELAGKPWMNTHLGAAERTQLVLKEMTQEEKLRLVMGYFGTDLDGKHYKRPKESLHQSAGFVYGIPRLGIPDQWQTDAGVGVASQRGPNVRERTSLPSGMNTAATWSPEVGFAGGAMIGAEARSSGFNEMLAGGVNLVREPRNGRNFEYGGEDPLLAGTIVGAQIKGIQSNHIISTLKHYALNDQETGRNFLNVEIDDAAARMSDLLAFQIANEVGNPGSVMCSYNRLDGIYACENPYLLNEVLKGDWGFKGFVMSDWGATHSTVQAANNGLDQQSGVPFDKSRYFGDALGEAVANGWVPQKRLDDMAGRVLYAMFEHKLIDDPVTGPRNNIDFAAHAKVTQNDAEEGMVLLKNDNAMLPIKTGLKKIAVIGSHADVGVLSGGGSSQVYPVGGMAVKGLGPDSFPGPTVYFPSSPLKAIQARAGNAKVTFNDGSDPAAAARLAAASDLVIVFAHQWTAEALDVPNLSLPDHQDALIAAVAKANPHTAVVLETGGAVLMPWLKDVGAVLEAWYPGTRGGEAIGRVLFGEVNPSGHLPITFPASEQQLPRPVLDGDPRKPELRFDVNYSEGAAVGYKWFDLKGLKPLFPFGYGLSYTSFSYDGLAAHWADGQLTVSFTIRNTGAVAGKDVAQVYVASPKGLWEAPKRLGAFQKLALKPGESRKVSVKVDPRLLAMYQGKDKTWKIASGEYQVTVAKSALDPQASVAVKLPATTVDVNGK
ncbi:MAG TPA: glycoside hydrolase family 3 C-terminal domain-containing protein [Rhodanobacter sp.]|nr:glycoside hydrolase family 3 C-terminal domain-containing protein [Rhodanobacter sp.]